jgi:large subunit ribosomal protein L10
MAKTKQQKVEVIEKLDEALKEAESAVFVNFHGLNVTDTTAMRQALAKEGVKYFVAKKTLVRRALEKAGIAGEQPSFDGEFALAWAKDATAPARGVYEFVKKYKDRVAILGGIFEGGYKNATEMTEIASIPSLQVLRGMFVNVINSPIQGLAVALDQIASKKQ